MDSGVGADSQGETMEELLAGTEEDERALRPLHPGEVVEGVVASVSGDEALVDLGGRSAGVLSSREASGEGTDVAVGDRVIAAVVQPEGPDGRVILSTRRARSRRQWTRMTELQKTGEVVEAEVVEANRGGVVVDVGLRGFVPLSQLGSVGSSPRPNAARSRTRFARTSASSFRSKSSRRINVVTAPFSRRRRRRNSSGVGARRRLRPSSWKVRYSRAR